MSGRASSKVRPGLRNELCSDSFHAVLAWSCGRAKCQCCTATVTVVVYSWSKTNFSHIFISYNYIITLVARASVRSFSFVLNSSIRVCYFLGTHFTSKEIPLCQVFPGKLFSVRPQIALAAVAVNNQRKELE